jgi:hypothetical protein
MATHATVWSGLLSSAESTISRGTLVVLDGDTYKIATTANRTSYGRSVGMALTAADSTARSFELQIAGIVPTAISGLGAGAATWVIASSTGTFERDSSPDSGDDIVGKCNAAGDVTLAFGVFDENNYAGGGGGGTAPTGDGFYRVTGGVMDAAASAVNLAGGATHVTGTLPIANVATGTDGQFLTVVAGPVNAWGNTVSHVLVTSYIGGPGTIATTGTVRLADECTVYARSGGTNYRLLYFTAGNLNIGESGAGVDNLVMYGRTSVTLAIGSTTMALINSSGLRLNDGTGQYYTFAPSNIAADRTITLPLLTGNDTMVTEAHSQTLSNKTLGSGTAITYTSVSATGNARYQPTADIANVQTTDATVTTLFSFTPTDEAVTVLTVEALAVRSTGAEVNGYIRRVKIKRDGGTVTLGSVVDVWTDEETAAWDCTVDLSGTTVRVRVTGEGGKTIDWGCTATRQVMTHA